MANETVKTLEHSDGLRRVDVFVRSNGTFGFTELVWDAEDRAWCPFGRYSDAVCDSAELAESEARGRVSWLAARAP
jgi:hypothetical protein